MCYEWLFSQQILEALITMLYTTLYAIVVGICIYYCRYVYTQYLYYNIYIHIQTIDDNISPLFIGLIWSTKIRKLWPLLPFNRFHSWFCFSVIMCIYTHNIYIYTHLSPLWYSIWIFHLAIGPLHPNISHNPITHSYWTLPFYGTRYVVSSPTSTMLSRVCSI